MPEKETKPITVKELIEFLNNYPDDAPVYMQVLLNTDLITYPVEDIASDKDELQCILLCGDEVEMIEEEG